MNIETWQPIPGFVGIYEVSDLGRIRSLARTVFSTKGFGKGCRKRIRGRLLKHNINRKGYHTVGLHIFGKARTFFVHRLVCHAFVGNHNDLPEVNHIDGVKSNNNHTNLEPCTRVQNVRHAIQSGLCSSMIGEASHVSKLSNADVLNVRRMFDEGMSQMKISKLFGVTVANVHCIVRRKSWRHI